MKWKNRCVLQRCAITNWATPSKLRKRGWQKLRKTHIINYAKIRSIYEAYRKAGYSKRFLEANRESIALHKAAKAAFDEAGLKKLPKVKELSIEYVELLKKKKAEYPSYRKARERMQELMKAQKNVEMFLTDNRSEQEQQQTR